MGRKKPLSRRTFLRGAGGIVVALPFLDAMIPTFARAQSVAVRRFIPIYYGSVSAGAINPSSVGPLPSSLGASIKNLESVKQYFSIISQLNLPQVNNAVPGPGEAEQAQHYKVESPILSGVRSLPKGVTGFDNPNAFIRGTTSDQYAADFLGAGSLLSSLQVRLQASIYNNTGRAVRHMSVRKTGSTLEEMRGIISPQQLFDKLFSSPIPGGGSTPSPSPSSLPARDKSVLDLVLDDANRLTSQVSGQDKERLEIHFEKIREMERAISSVPTPSPSPTPGGSTCSIPNRPGADPAISTQNFGGWANETLRGQIQADLIAHAIQCDLTRVVSWMLTAPQVWLGSEHTSGSSAVVGNGGVPDIHNDSHNGSKEVNRANFNWASQFFGRLIQNLAILEDQSGPLIQNTLVTMVTAEGTHAHNRSNLTYMVAGCPDRIKLGHHISAGGAHPARVLISGLRAIGMQTNSLGEVTGHIDSLHV